MRRRSACRCTCATSAGLPAPRPAIPRTQLTSSVDVVPLLLTLATGSSAWRRQERYRHLAARHNLAAICAHPAAPGRPWILHATDEDVTEFAIEPYAASAPRHVVALRTQRGKLALYSNWREGTLTVEAAGQEFELYDYSSPGGVWSCSTAPAPRAPSKRNSG